LGQRLEAPRELLVLQREHVELIPYLWVVHRGDECADRVRNLTIAFGFSRPNRIGTRHRAGCPCPQPPSISLKCKHAATRRLSGARKPSRRAQFPVPSEMTYALIAPSTGRLRLQWPEVTSLSADCMVLLPLRRAPQRTPAVRRCEKATPPGTPCKGAKFSGNSAACGCLGGGSE
jgi:hypothetical protein